ncbi:hypothetical protein KY363_03660 [Candidatus Woesearchaeota archaeon]|nr:hypothetical protein [Candidatus Woesearchaeota archaeon]
MLRKLLLISLVLLLVLAAGCAPAEELKQEKSSADASVEVQCPAGNINDPAPGQCGLYTDDNRNGVCDYSETK